jgi:hypothetical protein
MRWLRLLASLPVALVGLLALLIGILAAILAVRDFADEGRNIVLVIPLLIAYGGMALGGAVAIRFAARLFRRNVRSSVA